MLKDGNRTGYELRGFISVGLDVYIKRVVRCRIIMSVHVERRLSGGVEL